MTTLALTNIQQALYSKLTGDGVLMGMITGVYDAVPERTALPYVVIGDGSSEVADSLASTTTRCELEIEVWTDIKGRKSALIAMDRIYGILHQGTLSVSGFELLHARCLESFTELVEVGPRLRGVLRFEILVREAV